MATPTTTATEVSTGGMKKTLGLTGVTVNAMALIAPGAFLWLTFQLQANQSVKGTSTAADMVPGLIAALILAFLTAISYSELANLFPNAGTGSSYYFAEAALLNREETNHYRFARLSKFVVGWTSHLYYWVYPGLIVGTFSTLIQFVASTFGFAPTGFTGNLFAWGVAIVMAIGVGSIAYRGITGSTTTAIAINVIQIVSLAVLSTLAIVYRLTHSGNTYDHSSAIDVVIPHSFSNVIFQATIAILLLVGFESVTSLGAETKDAKKNIPRGIILSLVIQGLICYLFEYFSTNFFMGSQYKNASGTGLSAAAGSLAPIGDMAKIIGDWLGGWGFTLTIIIAITVMIALIGTTLSCLNTGVRVTYAMGKDREIPSFFGLMHVKYAVPHTGVIVLTGLSALVGIYCSTAFGPFAAVDTLTQVTLVSNIGTLLLYGMTCIITIVAFHGGTPGFSFLKHRIVPGLGVIANIGLLGGIIGLSILAGGTSATDADVAMGAVGVFLVLGIVLLFINSRSQGKAILHTERPAFSLQAEQE